MICRPIIGPAITFERIIWIIIGPVIMVKIIWTALRSPPGRDFRRCAVLLVVLFVGVVFSFGHCCNHVLLCSFFLLRIRSQGSIASCRSMISWSKHIHIYIYIYIYIYVAMLFFFRSRLFGVLLLMKLWNLAPRSNSVEFIPGYKPSLVPGVSHGVWIAESRLS